MKYFITLIFLFNTVSLFAAEALDAEDAKLMEQMKTRRTMLDWHRYTAWGTVALMGATIVTAPEGEVSNTHKILGILSGVGYLTSASLAYYAPRPEDTAQGKNIFIHKI